MAKKESNAIQKLMRVAGYFWLFYLLALFFVPNIVHQADPFFVPFMSVFFWVYGASFVVIMTLAIIALVVMFFVAYTEKADEIGKKMGMPDSEKWYKRVFTFAKQITIVALTSHLGFGFFSVLASIELIWSIVYMFVEKDFAIKVAKIQLLDKE